MKVKELDGIIGGLILNNKKINKSQLAKKYGVSRGTIIRHINNYKNPKKRKLRECGLLKHYDVIKNMLTIDSCIKTAYMSILNTTSFDEIGTYSNFKQYVEKHLNEVRVKYKEKIAKFRYETPAGEQLQFDWVEGLRLHLTDGKLISFNLWSATLGYSKMHVFKYVESLTKADLEDA